jgi:hypothetical protein
VGELGELGELGGRGIRREDERGEEGLRERGKDIAYNFLSPGSGTA